MSAAGHWIDRWEPEDEGFWEATGRLVARKNLIFSIFAENIGFSIWVLWTIVVINLPNVGITLSLPEQFWLTATPNLIGSALRLPYTFAVPRFGGRMWTTISASLLPGWLTRLLLSLVVVNVLCYLPYAVFNDWWYLRFLLPGIAIVLVMTMAAIDAINTEWGPGTVRYAAAGLQPRWHTRCARRSPRYTTRWNELVVVRRA